MVKVLAVGKLIDGKIIMTYQKLTVKKEVNKDDNT